jgi:hypothetical protein
MGHRSARGAEGDRAGLDVRRNRPILLCRRILHSCVSQLTLSAVNAEARRAKDFKLSQHLTRTRRERSIA